MDDYAVKLVRAFELAKRVNHYYWVHTPDEALNMRVENIQRIVSWMSRLPVEKLEVDFEGEIIRGVYERYADRVVIYIRKKQSKEWIRFTIVKELCHLLIDQVGDFFPDGVETLRGLLKFEMKADDMTPALLSERLAEVTALELIYPLEFREPDLADLKAKKVTIADIVAKREVPSLWVQYALDDEYIEACKYFWKVLSDETPPPLEPL
jgi:Zn-dependent peptidase ImmA (M78 family)